MGASSCGRSRLAVGSLGTLRRVRILLTPRGFGLSGVTEPRSHGCADLVWLMSRQEPSMRRGCIVVGSCLSVTVLSQSGKWMSRSDLPCAAAELVSMEEPRHSIYKANRAKYTRAVLRLDVISESLVWAHSPDSLCSINCLHFPVVSSIIMYSHQSSCNDYPFSQLPQEFQVQTVRISLSHKTLTHITSV